MKKEEEITQEKEKKNNNSKTIMGIGVRHYPKNLKNPFACKSHKHMLSRVL